MTDNKIITELNGETIELTEEEIALLLEFRMADEEIKEKIRELIESMSY